MYRDQRPVAAEAKTASTPEVWAKTFAGSKPLNRSKRFWMTRARETRLIRRYIPGGATILDAGCGFGEWVMFLRGLGYRAVGADYSPELIRRLRETYPDGEWVQTDIRSLPQPDGSLDGIISWGVVEHDEAGPGTALREFHRVLRPDGIAIVSVPIDSPAARRAGQVVNQAPANARAFFQYFLSPEELRAEMTDAGFDVLETGTIPEAHIALVAPRLMLRLSPLATRVANLAIRLLLSWVERYRVMTYVVARKPSAH